MIETCVTLGFYLSLGLFMVQIIMRYIVGIKKYWGFMKQLQRDHPLVCGIISLTNLALGIAAWILSIISLFGSWPEAAYGLIISLTGCGIGMMGLREIQDLEDTYSFDPITFQAELDKNMAALNERLQEQAKKFEKELDQKCAETISEIRNNLKDTADRGALQD